MIQKNSYLEILVNGRPLEINQSDINLRFNAVIYNPEKASNTQSEYSFEIDVPATPNNCKVFGYANALPVLNKYTKNFNAEVVADGVVVFKGSLMLKSYKDKTFKCNCLIVKQYNLDEIFGEATLNMINWEIPFEGGGDKSIQYTIDYYNDLADSPVTFPLVSYGVFTKNPESTDNDRNTYTSKFAIDQFNTWYVESFYPSLNMLETIKKAFEWKGYTVNGNVFDNVQLKNIFMSTNLADEQSPVYNLGDNKFGKLDLTATWINPLDTGGVTYGLEQELRLPYYKANDGYYDILNGIMVKPTYNFDKIKVYNMLSSGDGGSVTTSSPSYLYQPSENCIIIPDDGFYKISFSADTILSSNTSINAMQWVQNEDDDWKVHEEQIEIFPTYLFNMPLEIQLVRNYDDDIELIKGYNNLQPRIKRLDDDLQWRYKNNITCYPHEKLGVTELAGSNSFIPTDTDVLPITSGDGWTYYPDGYTMFYDPAVNPKFLCGLTTMGNQNGHGCASIIKNGYSWSPVEPNEYYSFYVCNGYKKMYYNISQPSTHNQNSYPDSPTPYFYQYGNRSYCNNINCMVYLNKGDKLQLFGIHREYHDEWLQPVTYQTSATVRVSIEAASPKSYNELKASGFGYNTPSDFSTNLKLSEFLNKETKISEWIQSVADSFNFEIIQSENSVTINTKKRIDDAPPVAVELDHKVNSANAEASMIDYPLSMAIKYKIDTEEWGYEKTVPDDHINDEDWADWGDSGFTTIIMNPDNAKKTTSDVNLKFSYTYYDDFKWNEVNSAFTPTSADTITLRMPVISKFSYMIDGYDYDESMTHDGYGLAQRFWYRPDKTNAYVWLRTDPAERVQVYVPSNYKYGVNLSYKTTEPSLLKYFNITPYLSSNYVTVEVYLTPDEYSRIKNGSLVHVDSDIYLPVEVSGFDPSSNNPTTLKLMKKV